MEITVSARHLDVSPALRSAADTKFGRLGRFLGGIDRVEVHFFEERNPRISAREVCEVTLARGGRTVRAKAAASDPFAAIDLAVEKLEHQLEVVKSKAVGRSHGGRRPRTVATLPVPDLAPTGT